MGENDDAGLNATRRVGLQLDRDAAQRGGRWWNTPTARVIVDVVMAGPFATVLAGITEVLQEGQDPMWVVGGESATAAYEVAREWLDAGAEPSEVGDWLRAGCWAAEAARRMADVGLRPSRLLDAEGKPRHLVDAGPEGEIPVALAVAESYITAHEAVRVVVGQAVGKP